MSQLSPPFRILLVAVLALTAAWLLVLRPQSGEEATAPAPVPAPEQAEPNTSLGKAVQSAEGAAQESDAANERLQRATGEAQAPATTQPAPKSKPAPAAPQRALDPELADLPKWLGRSMDRKVVALLFWDKNAADDRRTRAALADAYDGNGKVVKRSVPIARIARYGSVARGVDVTQSPTLLVIDRDRSASALVGYANVDAVNQAIIDGLLATDNPAEQVGRVQRMQAACRGFQTTETISAGDATDSKSYGRDLGGVAATLGDALKAAPAARKGPYRSQARLLRRYIRSEQGVVATIRGSALGGGFVDGRKIRQAQRGNDGLEARATLQLNAIGVTGCN